jgi:hypothetical protein
MTSNAAGMLVSALSGGDVSSTDCFFAVSRADLNLDSDRNIEKCLHNFYTGDLMLIIDNKIMIL